MPACANLPLSVLLGDADKAPFLFDSSRPAADPIVVFYRTEAETLDWLADFLRRPEVDRLVEALRNPIDETEDEEDHYHRDFLTTTGEEFGLNV